MKVFLDQASVQMEVSSGGLGVDVMLLIIVPRLIAYELSGSEMQLFANGNRNEYANSSKTYSMSARRVHKLWRARNSCTVILRSRAKPVRPCNRNASRHISCLHCWKL